MLKRYTNVLWIAGGTLSLALGVLGIILPLLPTTPFLLLAAGCYARGSQRFYNWLLNNRIFGSYIRDYREGRGIPMHTKITTMIFLWGTIGASIYLVDHLHVRLLLPVIAACVSIHVLTRPTR